MSASNVTPIWSPTRSMSGPGPAAIRAAWPTSLTIASSVARCRVSLTSRALSSATLRLDGERREESNVRVAESVRAVDVLQRDVPAQVAAAVSGTNSTDLDGSPTMTTCSGPVSPASARRRRDEAEASAAQPWRGTSVDRRGLGGIADAILDVEGIETVPAVQVVDADVDDLRVEDVASFSPTSSYIACMSSCSARPSWTLLMIASSAARCGLGEQPLRLGEQPGVLERDAHARPRASSGAARRPR